MSAEVGDKAPGFMLPAGGRDDTVSLVADGPVVPTCYPGGWPIIIDREGIVGRSEATTKDRPGIDEAQCDLDKAL